MTKAEAMQKVLEEKGGVATLEDIYANIEKYYPAAKSSAQWDAGLRGVLYREIKNHRRFKKIGLSLYALADYREEQKPQENDKVRMHSYIEGICLELGNFKNYCTYTADPSVMYRDTILLQQVATLAELPTFSYPEIMHEARRIDVVWLNKMGLKFPQMVFEVVDSVSTLTGAFNRSLQLQNFQTKFFIVAPEQHRGKYDQTLNLLPYSANKSRFTFVNYDEITELYENVSHANKIETKLFMTD